jgi:hypothetical protein
MNRERYGAWGGGSTAALTAPHGEAFDEIDGAEAGKGGGAHADDALGRGREV